MKNNNSIKTVVAIGIGAALFFVLGRFVAIPSPVPNTNISLQYAVLGLLAAMYGPVAGGLIGFIGHTLIDLLGWKPMVELGYHICICRCCDRSVRQEASGSGRRFRKRQSCRFHSCKRDRTCCRMGSCCTCT